GRGSWPAERAAPPTFFSVISSAWPNPSATERSTRTACVVTSGPIPSPGKVVIFISIGTARRPLAAKNYLAAHNCRHHLPGHLPSIKRRVVRLGARLCRFKRPSFLGIEDGHVGVAAAQQRASPAQIEHSRRSRGHEL